MPLFMRKKTVKCRKFFTTSQSEIAFRVLIEMTEKNETKAFKNFENYFWK